MRALYRRLAGRATFLVVTAGAALAAEAHHSFSAEFDPETTGELEGRIARVWFANPHVRYRLEVEDEAGNVTEWDLQLASVTTLRAADWGPETLSVGDRVTVRGQLGRGGANKLFVRSAELADGTNSPMAPRATPTRSTSRAPGVPATSAG